LFKKCAEFYREFKEQMPPDKKTIAGTVAEASDRDIPALQAADLLVGQMATNLRTGKPELPWRRMATTLKIMSTTAYPPGFESLPDLISHLNVIWSTKPLGDIERLDRTAFCAFRRLLRGSSATLPERGLKNANGPVGRVARHGPGDRRRVRAPLVRLTQLFPNPARWCENRFMRPQLQPGQSRVPWARAVMRSLWILLVAQSCAAQTASTLGTLRGAVTDSSGAVVEAAIVSLQAAGSTAQRTTVTDQTGSFRFSAVEPGAYALTITAAGFTDRKTDVSVASGENPPLPPVVLQIAPAISKVDVGLPPHELAMQQVRAEEKQRLLGIFPNFYVSYEPNAAPLTAAQKFQLGLRTIIDPEVILGNALSAGIEQWHNSNRQFGQGMEGYGKRFGADYATSVIHVMIGHTLTQSVFHQDPRYFYKGTGSFGSRFLYAIGAAFVAKGDNGRWQPDYSDMVGGLAAGEISNLYYPGTSRPGLRAFHRFLLGFSGRASSHLLQEFVYRKLTTHVPKVLARPQPVLRDGTPVSLFSVEDLRSATPQTARPITFVLAKDLDISGVIAAKAGSKVEGQVTSTVAPSATGTVDSMHLSLENVRLKIGQTDIPLRSSPRKGDAGVLEYHWLEDGGRIALVLYVAGDVTLATAR
jgi:Carboxypeptidase regulatory-like domain